MVQSHSKVRQMSPTHVNTEIIENTLQNINIRIVSKSSLCYHFVKYLEEPIFCQTMVVSEIVEKEVLEFEEIRHTHRYTQIHTQTCTDTHTDTQMHTDTYTDT